MKINELVQTGTRTEEYTYTDPETGAQEQRTREVPVMTAVTRDMTDAEMADFYEPDTRTYTERVVARVRARYSVDDELAILRQRNTKSDEFMAYNAYVEQIKTEERTE